MEIQNNMKKFKDGNKLNDIKLTMILKLNSKMPMQQLGQH